MKKLLILIAVGTAFGLASCASTSSCCGQCSAGAAGSCAAGCKCEKCASKCKAGCKCAKCQAKAN